MANFNGQLRSNDIFAALYNMIISQEVISQEKIMDVLNVFKEELLVYILSRRIKT